jgi:hypothetical protein
MILNKSLLEWDGQNAIHYLLCVMQKDKYLNNLL